MNDGKLNGADYLDLSKALDTIGHNVSQCGQKLSAYGTKDKELEWFCSYFSTERIMFLLKKLP